MISVSAVISLSLSGHCMVSSRLLYCLRGYCIAAVLFSYCICPVSGLFGFTASTRLLYCFASHLKLYCVTAQCTSQQLTFTILSLLLNVLATYFLSLCRWCVSKRLDACCVVSMSLLYYFSVIICTCTYCFLCHCCIFNVDICSAVSLSLLHFSTPCHLFTSSTSLFFWTSYHLPRCL